MSERMNPPLGILFIRRLRGRDWSLTTYRYVVLLLTFIAYACYHASRKPTSIVKSVLYPDPQKSDPRPWPLGNLFINDEEFNINKSKLPGEGWAPFNGDDGTVKLGVIDLAFLACYSAGMYVAGHLGDSLDLRLFLALGMIASGTFVALFGMGYFWNIHFFVFYLVMQLMAGLFQATGWPSVVAVIGNWFGKRRRGLIMGIWNAHTSVGNITGSLLAASVLEYGWGWSFILPGALIFLGGLMVFLFLAAYPEDVGFTDFHEESGDKNQRQGSLDEEAQVHKSSVTTTDESISPQVSCMVRGSAVGLFEACRIPGVIPFAICLFFTKLVAYTFLYWLPFYINQTAIGGEYVSVKSAGNLSTLFDVGGIVGGILAGYISDKLNARAIPATLFTYAAIPSLYMYRYFGSKSMTLNVVLMMVAGLFVNGPYALITTAVSADLGTHSSLSGNSRALATVTAIIDGTGSMGAALGPLLTGYISTRGWSGVFVMLCIGCLIAGLLLSGIVLEEYRMLTSASRRPSNIQSRDRRAGSVGQPLLGDERHSK